MEADAEENASRSDPQGAVMKTFVLLAMGLPFAISTSARADGLTPVEELGKNLFFDTALSTPPGQSCASCHDPAAGWTGPDSERNAREAIYEGAVATRAGNRKPPSAAYAGFHPALHRCGDGCGGGMGGGGMGGGGMGGGGMGGGGMGGGGMGGGGMGGGGMMSPDDFVGGMFWDGRATGWELDDPLAEQAMGPFLNPLEQSNPNERHVCLAASRSAYTALFEEAWGPGTLDCVNDVDGTYERIARSIAAYERSTEVNPFSSRFDGFWDATANLRPPVQMINQMNWTRFTGKGLTDVEVKGLMVFNTKGKCSECHPLRAMNGSGYPLFTDFRYHNLGIPKLPENPFYAMPRKWNPDGERWVDLGLGGFLATTDEYAAYAAENLGKQKTPTLRNVGKRPDPAFAKAYGHNGYFKSLMEIIHFYNLRDVLPTCSPGGTPAVDCWPPAEVSENVDRTRLGNLQLTPEEGMALVAFLGTLTDGDSPDTAFDERQ
jgi:cytochrome c peroxidase